jgi:hypothetical protein
MVIFKKVFLWELAILALCVGCQTKHEVEVKPIEIKPMEVTLNINLNIKMVNEDLNHLFGEK